MVQDSGAKIIITLDRFWEDVEPLQDAGVVNTTIITGIQDGLPPLKRWLYPLKYRNEMVDVPHQPERSRVQYREVLKGAPANFLGTHLRRWRSSSTPGERPGIPKLRC